jgi:DNA invertase Pin-like site-specific DNA recombinase
MATGKFIAYYRVSTARQGSSGLGLEAQRKAVADYLNGGSWDLIDEFVEVESGKRNDRPELAKAIAACRKHKATLVIAKLDRLARNVAFVSALMEAGVDFIAADMPTANRLTVHILAAVAEHEREMISNRTKAALAQAKARGRKLGWAIDSRRNDQLAAARKGAAVRRSRATAQADNVVPIIRQIEASGATTLQQVADALNARGIPTARGGSWHPATVARIKARAAASA